MDKELRIVALVLRSLTDITIIIHIIRQIRAGLELSRETSKRAYAKAIAAGRIPSLSVFNIIIYSLTILPIPQLAVLVGYFRMRDSGFLNFILLFQYVPTVYRLHLSSKRLPMKGRWVKWVTGSFNFVLYIFASHVLGAFWYFFSIQREISCWYQACGSTEGCIVTHHCNDSTTSKNTTFLNELCPIHPSNAMLFDFGIFLDALRSGNTGPVNFPRKFFYSLWWGIRNLSNFGTNLQTSSYVWENCFSILISVIGLLLFLYLIGNVQALMQLGTTKSVEIEEKKLQEKIKKKEETIHKYLMSKSGLPQDKQTEIKKNIDRNSLERNIDADVDMEFLFSLVPLHIERSSKDLLEKFKKKEKDISTYLMSRDGLPQEMHKEILDSTDKDVLGNSIDLDVDMQFLFSLLPLDIRNSIRYHLGMNALKKVRMLQYMNAKVLEMISYHLSPVTYTEYSSPIFRAGDAIQFMLFIIEGDVSIVTKDLKKGDYFGEELLCWVSPSVSFPDLKIPISTQHLQCGSTKLEAFALMAEDLRCVVSDYRVQWNSRFYCCDINSQELAELDELDHRYGTDQTYILSWEKLLKCLQRRKNMKDILEWVSRYSLPEYFKTEIMKSVIKIRRKNYVGHVGWGFVFISLPLGIKRAMQEYVGLNALRKVPMLQNMPESLLVYLCRYLRPVTYYEAGSYVIRSGEFFKRMLFIVEGVIISTSNTTCDAATTATGSSVFTEGDIFGEELLTWALQSNTSLPEISSTRDFKCQTKVRAFILNPLDVTGETSILGTEWTSYFNSQRPLPILMNMQILKQKYMQFETTKLEEIENEESRQKMKIMMKEKEIFEWVSKSGVPEVLIPEIMARIKVYNLVEKNIDADVDVNYLFSIDLPWTIKRYISYTLFINALNKVPMLENVDDNVVHFICSYAEPVICNADSYIVRAGEPHDSMLIIIQGLILSTDTTSTTLGKGDLVGEELLSWVSPDISLSRRGTPISTRDVKCQTKVEAFAVTARDIMEVVSRYGLWGQDFNSGNNSQQFSS